MFKLNLSEYKQLARSQFVTAQIWTVGNEGGRTSLPFAFTEQGIYMLMTVLNGELATKQSGSNGSFAVKKIDLKR